MSHCNVTSEYTRRDSTSDILYYMQKSKSGFTIVELLIVIVVIAILATITIVTFNGIQQRARDNKRHSDAKTIMKLIELYKADSDDGRPPQYSAGGSIDVVLTAALTPKYANTLPQDTKYPYRYAGMGANHAIQIYQEKIGGYCKISHGNTTAWWSSSPECTF